jgi:hypothetical protein
MAAILALQELPTLTALGVEALGLIDDGESCTVCTWTCDWTTCYCTSIEIA